MRLLVTGGCGFIGSAVIRHCLQPDAYRILNVDKLTYAACPDNLKTVAGHANYRFAKADIADEAAMERLMNDFRPNAIMHLAAESHVDRSIDAPAPFIETNIVGTFSLLSAARRYYESLPAGDKKNFRFHHISTDEVFGSLGDEGRFTEDTAYAPRSPYSASKAASDMLARAWHHTYELPVIVSNCSNNYGPYQFPEKLIPVAILAALEGRPIPVYGSGKNVRDWLFVEDHARALMCILERGEPGETYNVGGRGELSNLEIVEKICALMDELLPGSASRPHRALVSFVADRPGHDYRYAIDATKIMRDLGWAPEVTVEEGLRRTVSWYLENAWWWQQIRSRGFKDGRLGLQAAAT